MTSTVQPLKPLKSTTRVTLAQLKVSLRQKAQVARKSLEVCTSKCTLPALPPDLDPFFLDVTDSAVGLSEAPTSSVTEVDVRPQIERLFGKRTRPVGDGLGEEKEYEGVEALPELFVLGKKVTITSEVDFKWLADIDAATEIAGLEAASQGLSTPSDPKLQIYSASSYWAAEQLDTERWLSAFRTLYFSFLYERCPYFFVDFKRCLSVFKRVAGEPVAIISPASKHLRDLLSTHGVTCEPEQKLDDTEEVELVDIVKRRPGKSIGRKLVIKGKHVHCLYNYLVNEPEEATILSPIPFLHGTMRALQTTFAGEIQTPAGKSYRLILEGMILPSKLLSLLSLFRTTQQHYTMELERDSRSSSFGSLDLKSLRCNSTAVYVRCETS